VRILAVSDPLQTVVVRERLPAPQLARLVASPFGDMVKYVVDLARGIAAVGGELHADAKALLLEQGSRQTDLWGANYWPGRGPQECIEYTSLINIRPAQDNPGMEVTDEHLRERIRALTFALIGEGEPLA